MTGRVIFGRKSSNSQSNCSRSFKGDGSHRLKRRVYQNPGPNYSWHIDGYDKLKCWGFPIHGAIDGFSRRILWLEITRSNNSPNKIATFYARTVSELGGCPLELITDLGTENGLAAAMQSFFRDNPEAHRYVFSQGIRELRAGGHIIQKVIAYGRGFF